MKKIMIEKTLRQETAAHYLKTLMKLNKLFLSIALMAACLCSCDDTTDYIGGSVIDDLDNMKVTTATYGVASQSVAAGAVYSRNTIGYLGKVKDPETGAFLKSDFAAQFYTLEGTQLPKKSTIKSFLPGDNTQIIADSCVIYLYYDNYYGDSLASMKLKAMELSKPLEEGAKYYSDFNLYKEGYCRTEAGSASANKSYTLYDMAADTVEKKIKIKLPNSVINEQTGLVDEGNYAYRDKDGKGYYNYGTYLMSKFYENSANYKNSYSFIHNVCPGFYFQTTDGLGSMAYINISQMLVYYKYSYVNENNNDTTVNVVTTFAGTEEVLQNSSITNDDAAIAELASDNSCTYVKSPAGIFTRLTLPVDDIMEGHENDTINSARVAITRINNNGRNEYNFNLPSTLLMVPEDSMTSFFEEEKIADYKTSYLASFVDDESSSSNLTQNAYTFHNIAGMITYMYNLKKSAIGEEPSDKTGSAWTAWNTRREQWEGEHPNWNSVLIVPVTASYSTLSTSSVLSKVVNDMSISETRFVKGDGTDNSNIKISVIYSKFEKK